MLVLWAIILFFLSPIYPLLFFLALVSSFVLETGTRTIFFPKKTLIPVLSQNTRPTTKAIPPTKNPFSNGCLHHFLYLSTPVATSRFPAAGSGRCCQCRSCCHSRLSVFFHRSILFRSPTAAVIESGHLRCLSCSRCRCRSKARYDGHVSSWLSCLVLPRRPGQRMELSYHWSVSAGHGRSRFDSQRMSYPGKICPSPENLARYLLPLYSIVRPLK